jgi:hypothetical protein
MERDFPVFAKVSQSERNRPPRSGNAAATEAHRIGGDPAAIEGRPGDDPAMIEERPRHKTLDVAGRTTGEPCLGSHKLFLAGRQGRARDEILRNFCRDAQRRSSATAW